MRSRSHEREREDGRGGAARDLIQGCCAAAVAAAASARPLNHPL